jgi:hypothetical protein
MTLCWFLTLQHPFLQQEANTTGVLIAIDGTAEYAVRHICFPPGFRSQARCFLWWACPLVILLWCQDEPGAHEGPASSVDCAARRCTRSPCYLGDPCSLAPLTSDERPAAHGGPPHRTRRNHGPPVAVIPLVQHAGPQFPILSAGSSSEYRVQPESGQAETKASDSQGKMRTDHLGVRKWQPVPGRQAVRLYKKRACPEGCVPGATDGSMPVGSVSIIYFPIIIRLLALSY